MQIAGYYGYKNPNDFAKNALNYNSPEKINRLKDPNKKPSVDILLDISNKFENVNIDWLLNGRGEMIRQEEGKSSKKDKKTDIAGENYLNKNALEMIKDLSAENALLKYKLDKLGINHDGSAAKPE